MEPSQRKLLLTLLFAGVILAGIFQFLVMPVSERPNKVAAQRTEQSKSQRAQERFAAIARAKDVALDARRQWRKDVVAAGGTGATGLTPPLILLRRNDAGEYMVTNISGQPICIIVSRVELPSRCQLGGQPAQVCTPLNAGEEREFTSPPREGSCRARALEFQIGRPVTTDLPWWSESALEEFDRVTALMESEFAKAAKGGSVSSINALSTEQIRQEANDAQAYLSTGSMASRWKPTLDTLQQVQTDSMTARQSGSEGELRVP